MIKRVSFSNMLSFCRFCLFLPGLEPADIRCAQEEFRKFDMEYDGQKKAHAFVLPFFPLSCRTSILQCCSLLCYRVDSESCPDACPEGMSEPVWSP